MRPASSGLSHGVENNLWRCGEHSARQAKPRWLVYSLGGILYSQMLGTRRQKAAVSFYGSRITLLGNATLGMSFTLTVDGLRDGWTKTFARVKIYRLV
jgi:hypothetical protein